MLERSCSPETAAYHATMSAMKLPRKAIIAAAGMGTRFLPQTKAMPKEMLPIIDKPVIQWVVEEAVAAGVTDIIIVTGSTKRAIEDHFDRTIELEEDLAAKGKHAQAKQIQDIAEMANFIYVRQKGIPKGNARPIINAAHLIADEPFFVFFADDFFTGQVPRAVQLLEQYKRTQKSVIALYEVPREDTNKYGIAAVEPEKDSLYRINSLLEKPGPEHAPSNYASIGGYLLTPDVLPIISALSPASDGEIRIPDALNTLAEQGDLYGCLIDGQFHDTGSPEVYIKTVIDVALTHPELRDEILAYMRGKM